MNTTEIGIIAGILALAQLVNAFLTFHNFGKEAQKPMNELKETDRILQESIGEVRGELESLKKDVDHMFDKERELEKNTLVLERGLLALITHELDGNHTQALEEAKKDLEEVIWKKDK